MIELISNPEQKKQIKDALQEISDAMVRMDGEKSLIKEIKDNLFDEHKDKLTKKQINKLAKTFYKQSFKTEVQENEYFEVLYQSITNEKADD